MLLLEAVMEMVDGFNVSRVQLTPSIDGTELPLHRVALWLKSAASALPNTQLAIEFLSPTNVPEARTAQRLIELAGGASNLGLCIDSWNVFRGSGLTSLQCLDFARVFMIQINDGKMQPTAQDYIQDCLSYKLPCGEGQFDLPSFMRLLPAGTRINVEVINDKLEPTVAAEQLYRTTVPMLELCSGPRPHIKEEKEKTEK